MLHRREYLSTAQAAALLGLKPRTLVLYRRTGKDPAFAKIKGPVRDARSDNDERAPRRRKRPASGDEEQALPRRSGNGGAEVP